MAIKWFCVCVSFNFCIQFIHHLINIHQLILCWETFDLFTKLHISNSTDSFSFLLAKGKQNLISLFRILHVFSFALFVGLSLRYYVISLRSQMQTCNSSWSKETQIGLTSLYVNAATYTLWSKIHVVLCECAGERAHLMFVSSHMEWFAWLWFIFHWFPKWERPLNVVLCCVCMGPIGGKGCKNAIPQFRIARNEHYSAIIFFFFFSFETYEPLVNHVFNDVDLYKNGVR